MAKSVVVFALAFVGVFIIDQHLKAIFLEGFRWSGDYFSFILTFNRGVAFSMLAFLDENLKYIKSAIILGIFIYLLLNRDIFKLYALPAGLILGAGSSNLYDRFIHGGVVDYLYWHKWFSYPVFNFADVVITLAVIVILVLTIKYRDA
jgi:signal peptidase II